MKIDIIQKLEQSGLVGRGGACFPTHLKWQAMKDAQSDVKYLVCNGSEGERGVTKDKYILENYSAEMVEGIRVAFENLGITKGYIYLNPEYFKLFSIKLKKLFGELNLELIEKRGGYLAGAETVLCNVIEGKDPLPRKKPPYPTTCGINGKPTLINNVETFYHVAKIAKDEYEKTRFYSISGEVKNPGVYELSEKLTMKEVLRLTNNYPEFDFFAQVGGGWSGSILLEDELEQAPYGGGAIMIYKKNKETIDSLLKELTRFFVSHNCDKCVPCREGSYRIEEMIKVEKIEVDKFKDLIFNLKTSSFCPYGKMMAIPFEDIFNKLL